MVQYRPSPNEEERLLREERDKRRLLRMQQVREQAKENAARVRESISDERERLQRQLTTRQENEWKEDHEKELERAQQLYLENILSLGQGHQGASDENIEGCRQERVERQAIEESRAKQRFQEALARQKESEWMREEERNRRVVARQIALDIERARAIAIVDLPKPKPDPIDTLAESGKKSIIVAQDRDTFSTSHYHMADTTVEKTSPSNDSEANAMVWATHEQERINKLDAEFKKFSGDSSDKANARYKHAIGKELLKKDYLKLVQDLSDIQREDLNKRRKRLEKLPKSVYEAVERRQEGKEEEQDMMERAFEHAYLNQSSPVVCLGDHMKTVDLNDSSHSLLSNNELGYPAPRVTNRSSGLGYSGPRLTNRSSVLEYPLSGVTNRNSGLDYPASGVVNTSTGTDDRTLRSSPALTHDADPETGRSVKLLSSLGHSGVDLSGRQVRSEEMAGSQGGGVIPASVVEHREHRYDGRDSDGDERNRVSGGFGKIGSTSRESGALQKLFTKIQSQRNDWIQQSLHNPLTSDTPALKPSPLTSDSAVRKSYPLPLDSSALKPLTHFYSPSNVDNKPLCGSLLSEGTLSDDTRSSAGIINSITSNNNRSCDTVLDTSARPDDVSKYGDCGQFERLGYEPGVGGARQSYADGGLYGRPGYEPGVGGSRQSYADGGQYGRPGYEPGVGGARQSYADGGLYGRPGYEPGVGGARQSYADYDVESANDSLVRTVRGVNSEIMQQTQEIEQQRQKLELKLLELSSKKQQILNNKEFSLRSDPTLREGSSGSIGHYKTSDRNLYSRDDAVLKDQHFNVGQPQTYSMYGKRENNVGVVGTNSDAAVRHNAAAHLSRSSVGQGHTGDVYKSMHRARTSPLGGRVGLTAVDSSLFPLGPLHPIPSLLSSSQQSSESWGVAGPSDLVDKYLSLDKQRTDVEYPSGVQHHASMSTSTPDTLGDRNADNLLKFPASDASSGLRNSLPSNSMLKPPSPLSSSTNVDNLSLCTPQEKPLGGDASKYSSILESYGYIPSTFESIPFTSSLYPREPLLHASNMTTGSLTNKSSTCYAPLSYGATSSNLPFCSLEKNNSAEALMSSAFSTPEVQQHEIWRLKPDGSILSYDEKRSPMTTEIQSKSSIEGSPYLSDVTQYRSLPFPLAEFTSDLTLRSVLEDDNISVGVTGGMNPLTGTRPGQQGARESKLGSANGHAALPGRVDTTPQTNTADRTLSDDLREQLEHNSACPTDDFNTRYILYDTPPAASGTQSSYPTTRSMTAEGEAAGKNWQSILGPYKLRDQDLPASHNVLRDDPNHGVNADMDNDMNENEEAGILEEPDLTLVSGATDVSLFDYDESAVLRDGGSTSAPAVPHHSAAAASSTAALSQPVSPTPTKSVLSFERHELSFFDDTSRFHSTLDWDSVGGTPSRDLPYDADKWDSSLIPVKAKNNMKELQLDQYKYEAPSKSEMIEGEGNETDVDESSLEEETAPANSRLGDSPGRGDSTGRGDSPGRGDSTGRGDSPRRGDSTGRGDSPRRGDSTGPGGSTGRGDSPGHGDSPPRGDSPGRGDSLSLGYSISRDTGRNDQDEECSLSAHETASTEDLFLASMYSGGSGQTPRGSEGGMSSSLSDIHSARLGGPFVRHSSLSLSITSWKKSRGFGKRRVHPEREMMERRIEGQADSDSSRTNAEVDESLKQDLTQSDKT